MAKELLPAHTQAIEPSHLSGLRKIRFTIHSEKTGSPFTLRELGEKHFEPMYRKWLTEVHRHDILKALDERGSDEQKDLRETLEALKQNKRPPENNIPSNLLSLRLIVGRDKGRIVLTLMPNPLVDSRERFKQDELAETGSSVSRGGRLPQTLKQKNAAVSIFNYLRQAGMRFSLTGEHVDEGNVTVYDNTSSK